MTIIGVVPVRMMHTDVDAEVDLMVLRIPPTGVNDLISICRGIDGTIGNPKVDAVMTVVIQPGPQTVRPVGSIPGIAHAALGWRCPGRLRRWTILAGFIAAEPDDPVIERIVGRGMIEDRFLRSNPRIRRIKKRCDSLKRRDRTFRRSTSHTEEESTEQDGCQKFF